MEENKVSEKAENKIQEKTEEKKEGKIEVKEEAKGKIEKAKKDTASARGINLAMSTKEATDICDMIRGKGIDTAIKMIEEVIAFRRVVKMNKREVPHKHGKGIMAGRYPIKAAREFLRLLKQLKANAMHHELELEKYFLWCKADRASQPYRRGGRRFKRSHLSFRLEKLKETPKTKEAKK